MTKEYYKISQNVDKETEQPYRPIIPHNTPKANVKLIFNLFHFLTLLCLSYWTQTNHIF